MFVSQNTTLVVYDSSTFNKILLYSIDIKLNCVCGCCLMLQIKLIGAIFLFYFLISVYLFFCELSHDRSYTVNRSRTVANPYHANDADGEMTEM
jgi:hypothetical protein